MVKAIDVILVLDSVSLRCMVRCSGWTAYRRSMDGKMYADQARSIRRRDGVNA